MSLLPLATTVFLRIEKIQKNLQHRLILYFCRDISLKSMLFSLCIQSLIFSSEKIDLGINLIYFNGPTYPSDLFVYLSLRAVSRHSRHSLLPSLLFVHLSFSLISPSFTLANPILPLVGRSNVRMPSRDDLRTFFADAQIDIKAARLCRIGRLCRMIL